MQKKAKTAEQIAALEEKSMKYKNEIIEIKADVAEIKTMLQNVSANGRKGLNESLQDIHAQVGKLSDAVNELMEISQGSIAFRNLKLAIVEYWKKAGALKIFHTKKGTLVAIMIAVLVLNSILHPFNINMDIQAIWEFVKKIFLGGKA